MHHQSFDIVRNIHVTNRKIQSSFLLLVFLSVSPITFAANNVSTNSSIELQRNLFTHTINSTQHSNYQRSAVIKLRDKLHERFLHMQSDELKIGEIQTIFDGIDSLPLSNSHDDIKLVNQLANRINSKLTKATETVRETCAKINELIASERRNSSREIAFESFILPCPQKVRTNENDVIVGQMSDNEIGKLKEDNKKSLEILNYLSSAGHLHEPNDRNFFINSRLMDIVSGAESVNFRDVFFVAKDNYGQAGNCRKDFPNVQYKRWLSASTLTKQLILIVDFSGTNSNDEQYNLIKNFGKKITLKIQNTISIIQFAFIFQLPQYAIYSTKMINLQFLSFHRNYQRSTRI